MERGDIEFLVLSLSFEKGLSYIFYIFLGINVVI